MKLSELRCCHPDCDKVPAWVITEQGASVADSTQGCTDHVGYLLPGDFNDVATIGSILTTEEMAG